MAKIDELIEKILNKEWETYYSREEKILAKCLKVAVKELNEFASWHPDNFAARTLKEINAIAEGKE